MNLIPLEPIGISPAADPSRPVVLFREMKGERILPVWVSHLDAHLALIQNQPRPGSLSPHEFTKELLTQLNMQLEACVFEKIRGHHQYVRLHFKGSRKLKEMNSRADHVISLCLHTGCSFFTTEEVLRKSQNVETEMTNTALAMKTAPHAFKNDHRYLQ
jgi:bifunctional DNase/RNase